MYTAYFGLSALPFSIAPDPDYLFMSDRHREALSHLTYGLGTTGGFVLLTGEVGTGKTTISRRLMAQLPENTQTAFILNPTLSSQELLATICDELKIRYRKTGATLKTLTDKIQEKLLKNHKDNINTLLIIDEAQHLQAEVLEQLRLLTNLETNTKKLLQVILIGQPELQQLLQRRDLRQLAQRITARYHLMPLNKQEVAQYIQHRLSVADCYRVVFDKSAVAIIHQLSQGIPRLINLLCDRSLWIAYGDSKSVVNRKIVIKASSEALGEEYQVTSWWGKPLKVAATVLFSGGLIFSGVWWGQHSELNLANLVSTTEHNKNEDNLTETVKGQSIEDKVKTIAVAPTVQNSDNKPAISNDVIEQQPKQPIKQNKQPLVLGYKSEQYQQAHQIKATTNKSTANATQNIADNAEKYQVKAVKGVSAGLLKTFNNVLNETNNTKDQDTISVDETKKTTLPIKPLSQMPQWLQQALPSLHFEMHIYASDGQGWVRVNGRDAREGEKIAENLILEKIEPQKVLLNFRGEEFTMPALSSW